jgi:hypothetical protein
MTTERAGRFAGRAGALSDPIQRRGAMTVTADAIYFRGGRLRMTWQRVAALGLLVGGAVLAAAFHSDVIAATLAGAAAGFAVNRDADRRDTSASARP